MLRVALTGPESTGKTTLSRHLAEHYHTTWAPEYARKYLEERGPHYTLDDLEAIAHGQLATEEVAAAGASRILFCDTDLLVIKVWAEHAFGHCPEWIKDEIQQRHYDLVLLLNVDLPWEADPLREHPHLRHHFFAVYQQELRQLHAHFAEVSGTPEQRLEQACRLVDELLKV
ncbi:AAA family ATPase [Hymenobacter jejuensis]|uniref:ATP-binding protein n=1 Tax=Hymenobacter jejuensis TaxID=2502781 RepID=A0A5B8A0P7_9BACT|nr:ATP-binding protein [Hymenobacter jejuensis]QDA60828.1 ATP-binding protein [Hymenobacter jejuensis]